MNSCNDLDFGLGEEDVKACLLAGGRRQVQRRLPGRLHAAVNICPVPLVIYNVFIKYCFFSPRILERLPPLPRQHSAAIGCTQNYQPIGVTVHSHCVESFEGLLQPCRRGRGCSELGKNTIFLNTLYLPIYDLSSINLRLFSISSRSWSSYIWARLTWSRDG